MQDIRRQFSLDWLVGSDASSSGSQAQAALDEAIMFYGQPLIKHLSQAPNQEMHLHDLARSSEGEIPNFKFEELGAVIHRLVDLGFIRIVDEDPVTGNHLVKLLKTR